MNVAVFSTKPYDRSSLERANGDHGHDLTYLEPRLAPETAMLASGYPAICPFVNDDLSEKVLEILAGEGLQLVALRSAGFNHVDLRAALDLGITVARVPAYSPHAVAEHAVGLILTLNRRFHRAYARVREGNFALDGLLGFDLHGKTIGIVGTGRIGEAFARIMAGFGCRLLASDPDAREEVRQLGAEYVSLDELLAKSDIISLHLPLNPATHHLIDRAALARTKPGVMLINTSRGGLVDTPAVIEALKEERIGALGLDVYEEEEALFFEDLSDMVIHDDVFARLLTFPNVVVTGHQGFFTREALSNIAETTLSNITAFERGSGVIHSVGMEEIVPRT